MKYIYIIQVKLYFKAILFLKSEKKIMVYTVGDAAKMLNVAPSTLRYYDKEGLLPFVERSEGGIRMFKDSDLDWLKLIECLKRTGMPIKGIRQFIECTARGDGTIGERLDILERQRESVKKQIAELEEHLKMLDYKVWYYKTAQEEGTTAAMENYPKDKVPENLRKFIKNK